MKYKIIAVALLFLPTLVLAQGGGADAGQAANREGLSYQLQSPLAGAGIGSLEGLLTAILNILMVIAVPIIVFFVIFAGFNYVTAQGNQEKIKTATRSLTYAIIGAILILGAVALSSIIGEVVCSFSSNPTECRNFS